MVPWDRIVERVWVTPGRLKPEQYQAAVNETKVAGMRMDEVLLRFKLLTQEDLGMGLAKFFEVPYVDVAKVELKPELKKILPETALRRFNIFPWEVKDGLIVVAMANPHDLDAVDYIKLTSGKNVERRVTTETAVVEALGRNFGYQEKNAPKEFASLKQAVGAQESVQRALELAVQLGASDIHFEPQEQALFVLFRIDGVLQTVHGFGHDLQAAVISRIKVLAGMDITESRLPQDGQFTVVFGPRSIDFRVASIAAKYGEQIVIRVLEKKSFAVGLDHLGMPPELREKVAKGLGHSNGLFLVTGPTGAGKSSTLYAIVNHLKSPIKKFITIEDPIEYDLLDGKKKETGITQVQVNAKIGVTFPQCLRAALRLDPDVIMVGEIRDQETAEIALRAALTGHLVLSTLHTNDSTEAVARLFDMGVEPFVIASALRGVLAQRLARLLCARCKQPYTPPLELVRGFNKYKDATEAPTFYQAVGCEQCRGTGYRGRNGIFELLEIDGEIQEAIAARKDMRLLRERALAKGLQSLRDAGIELVAQGQTSLEEIFRLAA